MKRSKTSEEQVAYAWGEPRARAGGFPPPGRRSIAALRRDMLDELFAQVLTASGRPARCDTIEQSSTRRPTPATERAPAVVECQGIPKEAPSPSPICEVISPQ